MELLPEAPSAQESSEQPFPLEVDLPEEPAAVAQPAPGSPAGTDLEALMGGGADAAPTEPEADGAADEGTQADAKKESGLDLEDIFGSSTSTPEPEEQPEPALEMDAPAQTGQGLPEAASVPDETSAPPEISEPAQPEQSQAPTPAGSIEDELLHDLAADLPAPQAVEEPSAGQEQVAQAEPEADETGGGLDLDGLIDQAGAAASQVGQPQPSEPQAETQPRETPEPDRQLAGTAPTIAESEPVDTPQQEEVAAPSEPGSAEPEPENEPVERELASGTGQTGGAGSLVSLALQRAAQESAGQDEPLGAAEVAVDLDDGVELTDGGEAGSSEAEVLLTMNQTIDAIKKKTVKCPSCGTMNYAIRWYCESCEATLTAL